VCQPIPFAVISMAEYDGNFVEHGLVVAESRGWVLFDLGDPPDDLWRKFKLVAKVKQRKANFWLASNGERLALSSDAVKLNTHHPEVFDWVVTATRRGDAA